MKCKWGIEDVNREMPASQPDIVINSFFRSASDRLKKTKTWTRGRRDASWKTHKRSYNHTQTRRQQQSASCESFFFTRSIWSTFIIANYSTRAYLHEQWFLFSQLESSGFSAARREGFWPSSNVLWTAQAAPDSSIDFSIWTLRFNHSMLGLKD